MVGAMLSDYHYYCHPLKDVDECALVGSAVLVNGHEGTLNSQSHYTKQRLACGIC